MAYMRYKIGERICPRCNGSCIEPGIITNDKPIETIRTHKPEAFDLDCCQLCRGDGIVNVYNN